MFTQTDESNPIEVGGENTRTSIYATWFQDLDLEVKLDTQGVCWGVTLRADFRGGREGRRLRRTIGTGGLLCSHRKDLSSPTE